jgi:predicted extracellular nuclease
MSCAFPLRASQRLARIGALALLATGGALTAQDEPSSAASASAPVAIGQLQREGDGAAEAWAEREVVVEGVVTAMLDAQAEGGGFFLQDRGDGDPATSDALFVLDNGTIDDGGPPVGTRVRVRGTPLVLRTDAGLRRTALRPSGVAPLGEAPLPEPVAIAAPPADWARYASMRVRIVAPLTVAGTHRGLEHGELLVNFGERLRAPTEAAAPGAAAKAMAADNAARLLRLDDGRDGPTAAGPWFLPRGLPRTGSRLGPVEGIADPRARGAYLLPTRVPRLSPAARPRAPNVGGDLRVVAFNLENLFNGDGRGGGFPTPRGARTVAEYRAQLGRHLATIRALKPDVLALMELENDGYGPQSSIAALVEALRAAGLGDDWRFVDAGAGPGTDQIRVALLYRSRRVETVGAPATLGGGPFDRLSRVPLAQSFRALGSARPGAAQAGPVFTIAVNHFKSKGCGTPSGADADQGDGQGCWNATRTESARRLSAWLRSDPTGSGSDLAMIVGDLNAYGMEDPIQTLIADGWRDAYAGRSPAPYSYVFDAQTGRLDHALLSPALAQRLAGAAKWHSNADEPERAETAPDAEGAAAARRAPRAAAPWRSSDHDPLLLGFRLRR